MTEVRYAFLGGGGRIGTAIIQGLLRAHAVRPDEIVVTERNAETASRAAEMGVETTLDNRAAVRATKTLVICVHPGEVDELLNEIRDDVTTDHLVLSVATGVQTAHIAHMLGKPVAVVRAMPNIAVFVGSSMTSVAGGRWASREQVATAVSMMRHVGEVEVLDERHMNACTALGSCAPAFVFKIIEALAEGGVKVGLPREAARKMAAQALKGAAELVLQTGRHPAALKDDVTTPGGCTIDGITKLEERGLAIALIDAVEASARKAGLLFDSPAR